MQHLRMPGFKHLLFGSALFLAHDASAAGRVITWGGEVELDTPAEITNVTKVALGGFGLGLRTDGTVVGWGEVPRWGYTDNLGHKVPAGLDNVTDIAAGGSHSLALRANGEVVAWGAGTNATGAYPDLGQSMVPPGLHAISIAAGVGHSVAVRVDGTVVAWGDNSAGQSSVPAGLTNVVRVSANYFNTLALKADGTVTAWGPNEFGENDVPSGLSNVVEISAGGSFHIARKSDGTVQAWGQELPGFAALKPELTNIVQLAAGWGHGLARRGDGKLFVWGYGYQGWHLTAPLIANVTGIAASGTRSAVITDAALGFLEWPTNMTVYSGATVQLPAEAIGPKPVTYQWQRNGTNFVSGVGWWGVLFSPAQATDSGDYTVRASNSYGSATTTATLTVIDSAPIILSAGKDTEAVLGSEVRWMAEYKGSFPMTLQWRKDGVDIPLANSDNFSLSDLQPADAGEYDLVASNAFGTTISTPVTVSIVPSALVPWGTSGGSLNNYPAGSNFLSVACGALHNVVLRTDGTLFAWSNDSSDTGITNYPPGSTNIIAIAAGASHSLALRADNQVVAWARGSQIASESTNVPPGLTDVVAIAAGSWNSLALRSDGTLVAWGDSLTEVPADATNVVAIAAGDFYNLVLRRDGAVRAWGTNGVADLPEVLTNVVAISAGYKHALALKDDGTLVAWALASPLYPLQVPEGLSNVVAIAAGGGDNGSGNLALQRDGTVVGWSFPDYGWMTVSNVATNGIAIDAGLNRGFVLTGDAPPMTSASVLDPTLENGTFSCSVATQNGRVYCLEYKETLASEWIPLPLVAGTGGARTLMDTTVGGDGRFYRVRRW